MVNNAARLFNSAIQAANLGARFLFVFFLAKYLDPALVGYFGLFAATVSYALYFVGLDYYIYVAREIVKKKPEERGRLLKGQALLSAILYVLLMPITLIFLFNLNLPRRIIFWFFPILILEHFNQEMSRLLIVLSKPISSTVVLFFRQGAWSVAIAVAMMLNPDARNLDFIMGLWAVAGLIAASLSIWKLKELGITGWKLPVDWDWIKKGVVLSLTFLIGTLTLRGLQIFDRYWLEKLAGIEVVGAYVLLFGMANTLLVFLESALFSFSYPRLIQLNYDGNFREIRKIINKLYFQTLLLSVIFGIASWLVLPHLLIWIGNSVYIDAVDFYPVLLLAVIFNATSMVPHYALYACGVDGPIIKSHIASVVLFVFTTWIVSSTSPRFAVPIGLTSAFALIFVWKTIIYLMMISEKSTSKGLPSI